MSSDRASSQADVPAAQHVLVLGVGNELLGDEGFGVHVARELTRRPLPPGTIVVEAGVALLDFIPEMARAGLVILVDAVRTGGPPGRLFRRELLAADLQSMVPDENMSLHGLGVVETLHIAHQLGMLPPRLVLWGAEVETLGSSLELSPALAVSCEKAVIGILEELMATVER